MTYRESIEFYTEYFALAATSGIESSKSIHSAIAIIQAVNPATFSKHQDAIASKNNLFITLRSSYESIFTNAFSTRPMESSFQGLAKYILATSGQTVDEYLSEHGVKVTQTYANISEILGEDIRTSNID